MFVIGVSQSLTRGDARGDTNIYGFAKKQDVINARKTRWWMVA